MMKNNRRDFLKMAGLGGIGVAGASFIPACTVDSDSNSKTGSNDVKAQAMKSHSQHFNMCGYAAPKLETVRIGFIGVGKRGIQAIPRMNKLEGVEIKALCDLRPEKLREAKKMLEGSNHNPDIYTGHPEEWKKVCERDDIDLIYIATHWDLHTPIAVYSMNRDKHVCVEVPAAKTLDECWELVETSERTRKHCMMLENVCYGFTQLLNLNLARQGFFGEIIHAEDAYIHDLLVGNFAKDKYWNMWRLKENMERNGNLYPTHGIGPVCQVMNIGRGDKMDYMVSLSSNDFHMKKLANELASIDDFYKPYANKSYRGNMNTTTIRTAKGRTIVLQHDVTSPRPRPGSSLISGTKAIADGRRIFIASDYELPLKPNIWKTSYQHEWIPQEEYKAIAREYAPDIVKKVGEAARKVGGHGGMDFLMDWRTIDCLRNGLPLDQDVYDAALWSAISPLSEWSVANRATIDVPDFTGGAWKSNKPVELSLENGGNTKVNI